MSDPNPITLAPVDRLTPLTQQSARSGLQTLLRNGTVVEARVVGMLAGDVAQLEILGQKVEVSTQQALKAGTTLSVAVNRTGSSLELVIRPDNGGARPAQSSQPAAGLGRGEATGSLRPGAVSIENWVLAAHAATNEAVLSAETSATIASPGSQLPMAAYSAAGLASQQSQAESQAGYEQEPAAPAPGQDHGQSSRSLELVAGQNTDGASPLPAPQPLGFGRGYAIAGETAGSFFQSATASLEGPVLAAQAAINEAALGAETSFQNATLAAAPFRSIPAVQAAYAEAAFAPRAQLQAGRAPYELEARSSAPELSENEDARSTSSADETSQLAQQAAVSSPAAEQQDPNSAFAIQVPFQLPQMQRPIMMRVEEDDEDEARPAGRSQSTKRWTVNFSLDAGTIGPVHVNIGFSASSLTVRLASDQAESSSVLSDWLPELKTTLEQADFAVEDLSVREGGLT